MTTRSNLSILIDPKEHAKTLKSPIRDKLVNFFTTQRLQSPDHSSQINKTHRTSALLQEKCLYHDSQPLNPRPLILVANIPILGDSLKP